MSYNTDHLRTAGKITVYTTFVGLVVFAVVFIFNLGGPSVHTADAQDSATTTVGQLLLLRLLNLPLPPQQTQVM